jgi:hypothetical protein
VPLHVRATGCSGALGPQTPAHVWVVPSTPGQAGATATTDTPRARAYLIKIQRHPTTSSATGTGFRRSARRRIGTQPRSKRPHRWQPRGAVRRLLSQGRSDCSAALDAQSAAVAPTAPQRRSQRHLTAERATNRAGRPLMACEVSHGGAFLSGRLPRHREAEVLGTCGAAGDRAVRAVGRAGRDEPQLARESVAPYFFRHRRGVLGCQSRDLACESDDWSPRCAADFATEVQSIPFPTAGARDAGAVLVVDLTNRHAGAPWSIGEDVLIRDDLRAVVAALGITGSIYLP